MIISLPFGTNKNTRKQSCTRYEPKLIPNSVQSAQMTSHKLGGRLPLLPQGPYSAFPASVHHRLLVGIKLHCLMTECEQLVQSR